MRLKSMETRKVKKFSIRGLLYRGSFQKTFSPQETIVTNSAIVSCELKG